MLLKQGPETLYPLGRDSWGCLPSRRILVSVRGHHGGFDFFVGVTDVNVTYRWMTIHSDPWGCNELSHSFSTCRKRHEHPNIRCLSQCMYALVLS